MLFSGGLIVIVSGAVTWTLIVAEGPLSAVSVTVVSPTERPVMASPLAVTMPWFSAAMIFTFTGIWGCPLPVSTSCAGNDRRFAGPKRERVGIDQQRAGNLAGHGIAVDLNRHLGCHAVQRGGGLRLSRSNRRNLPAAVNLLHLGDGRVGLRGDLHVWIVAHVVEAPVFVAAVELGVLWNRLHAFLEERRLPLQGDGFARRLDFANDVLAADDNPVSATVVYIAARNDALASGRQPAGRGLSSR